MKDECKQVFTDIKLGRKYRYVVYRLTDDLKEITVESTAGVGKSFLRLLPMLSIFFHNCLILYVNVM